MEAIVNTCNVPRRESKSGIETFLYSQLALNQTARNYGVWTTDVTSSDPKAWTGVTEEARAVYAYIVYRDTDATLTEIAVVLVTDDDVVARSIERTHDRMRIDPKFSVRVSSIRAEIEKDAETK